MGSMTTVVTALPLLGLRIEAGPVELRGVTDDLIGPMADLAIAGIHAPDAMPFSEPWSIAPAEEIPKGFAQYHWGIRASFSPEKWTANLAVFYDGELVGVQGVGTKDYLVTRAGETGSWLARSFHGKGIGTAMRQVMCAFLFDHLDADHITSAAFTDNPASLAVSRKVGYTKNGWRQIERLGKPAVMQDLLLRRENFVRFEHSLTVEGLPEFRRSIGLDAGGREREEVAPVTGSPDGC
jgi:RimJ/RimL family protein N-acetyltransferase